VGNALVQLLAVIVTPRNAFGNVTASGSVWAGAEGRAIMGKRVPFRVAGLAREMMNPTTIPVTITPEAAARVAELGMQRELERMLEHALRSVPGLRSVEVKLELPYDTDVETSITIQVLVDHPNPVEDRTEEERAAGRSPHSPRRCTGTSD
jgi:hypothetical protein